MASRIGTTSVSKISASGSGRRRPRGFFSCKGGAGSAASRYPGGPAEAGLGGRHLNGVGLLLGHEQPLLAIGYVTPGQRRAPPLGKRHRSPDRPTPPEGPEKNFGDYGES